MSRENISSPPEMQRLNEIYGKWHVPPTYHTESWAVQALVGITITVTGQTFFRVGKEESSVAFLKQTQQKHLHDWKGQFWATFSGRSKRWLVNDLHISLQHTEMNYLCYHSIVFVMYLSFLFSHSSRFQAAAGEGSWRSRDTARTNGAQISRCAAACAHRDLVCTARTPVPFWGQQEHL